MTYQKFGLNCIRNQERAETKTPDNTLTKGRYIMNNEFEKNVNGGNVNDNNMEKQNTVEDNMNVKKDPDIANAVPQCGNDDASGNGEYVSPKIDIRNSENTQNLFENNADGISKEQEHDSQARKENSYQAQAVPENVSYNPHNDTYSYSKAPSHSEQVNGCVWDNTPEHVQKTHCKPKKSSKGFKVFVASMLTVFTLSAVTIASFMTANFISDRQPAAVDDSEKNSASLTVNTTTPTQISTFTESESGLTKSQVAAKCSPSSVGIVVEIEADSSYYGGFFGNFYSTPQITQGVGSGFIYDKNGYIITNHHVVDGAQKITVYLNDGTQHEAMLVGSDELSDIAVIKINPDGLDLVPMEIGNSDELVVGDEVIAIGCPAGIEFMGTVTDGIISSINRDVELNESGTTKTMTLLQTNATINKGNSGGPLINAKGQVIGINTLKLSADYEGIGFSIPINGALPIISQLIDYGKVTERTDSFVSSEGVIGISASDITESEAEYYDIPQGVLVIQIDKDSSAAIAGLRRGDIITAYNGTEVKTVNELNALKAANKAGDEVTITVYRDSYVDDTNKTFDITFTLDMA